MSIAPCELCSAHVGWALDDLVPVSVIPDPNETDDPSPALQ